jgi:hypothetical protein
VRNNGPGVYYFEIGDVKMQATTNADGVATKLSVPAANVVIER